MVRQTETAALRKAGKASNAKNKTAKTASSGSSNSNTFARGVVGVFSPGLFESVSLLDVDCVCELAESTSCLSDILC